MKIYFAGERDLKTYEYMSLIKNRLMSYYYHNINGVISGDLKNWFKYKKELKNESKNKCK